MCHFEVMAGNIGDIHFDRFTSSTKNVCARFSREPVEDRQEASKNMFYYINRIGSGIFWLHDGLPRFYAKE